MKLMRRRNAVELETWERWGKEAKSLRLRLIRLAGEVGNRVGKTKRATRLLERAQRSLELARCLLDGEYFRQHPTQATTHCFYGPDTEGSEHHGKTT